MANERGSYPHPVLDQSDDVESSFEVTNARILPSLDDIEVRFEIRTNDPTLEHLLGSGVARYSFRWDCSATMATDELEPGTPTPVAGGLRFSTWLDQQAVRRNVTVQIRVIASSEIVDFAWERQNPEYGDARFDLAPGDVLADGGQITFAAEKQYDPLDPPIGSCFKFVADPTLRRGVRVSFSDDDYIQVTFPEADIPRLSAMASQPQMQISTVVLPALMEAIHFIAQNRGDQSSESLDGRLWAESITGLVERAGGFDASPFDTAQKILDNPINRALATFAEIWEEDE